VVASVSREPRRLRADAMPGADGADQSVGAVWEAERGAAPAGADAGTGPSRSVAGAAAVAAG